MQKDISKRRLNDIYETSFPGDELAAVVRRQQRRVAARLRRGRLADATNGRATVQRQRHRRLGRLANVPAIPHALER